MKIYLFVSIVLLCLKICHLQKVVNDRPIIGVMAQESSPKMARRYGYSYIAASYVKFLESAGARVVPILLRQPEAYYRRIAMSINGLLYPGGGASITDSEYSRKGQLMFKLALEANKNNIYFPVWATCLGFELLVYIQSGLNNAMEKCVAQDLAQPLNLTHVPSRLIDSLTVPTRKSLQKDPVTINYHQWCLTPESYSNYGLDQAFKVLSTNFDSLGVEYVSTIEYLDLPIYGMQWHPEKNQFEFVYRRGHQNIPHSAKAIRVGQEFANFFVNEARKNNQSFASQQEEMHYLIYNYQPVFTGKNGSTFEQEYFFD